MPSRFQNFPWGACPWSPVAMLHGNDLQDSVLYESVEKTGVFSCNIRIALKYFGLDGSICSIKIPKPKRGIRCHQTVPRLQNFSGGACPRTPLARLRACRARLRTFHAKTLLRKYRFHCYPSDTTLGKSVSQVIVRLLQTYRGLC